MPSALALRLDRQIWGTYGESITIVVVIIILIIIIVVLFLLFLILPSSSGSVTIIIIIIIITLNPLFPGSVFARYQISWTADWGAEKMSLADFQITRVVTKESAWESLSFHSTLFTHYI